VGGVGAVRAALAVRHIAQLLMLAQLQLSGNCCAGLQHPHHSSRLDNS